MRFHTLHYWSLVLGVILPIFPCFVSMYIEASTLTAGFPRSISAWFEIVVFGPYALLGLGAVGCVLSRVFRNWPARPRYRFLFGIALGTGLIVVGYGILVAVPALRPTAARNLSTAPPDAHVAHWVPWTLEPTRSPPLSSRAAFAR